LRSLIATDAIDAVTFTSASTVENFFAKLTDEERTRVLQHATIASIGETTSAAIRKFGKEPDVVAKNATVQDLHDALVEWNSAFPLH
jgi:uroporphyrinogen III methyltransferase/synthase